MKTQIKVLSAFMLAILVSGCFSPRHMQYDVYQEKIMMCEHMGMRVHVVNTIVGGTPHVKSVVCYDRHGASWNAEQLRSRRR